MFQSVSRKANVALLFKSNKLSSSSQIISFMAAQVSGWMDGAGECSKIGTKENDPPGANGAHLNGNGANEWPMECTGNGMG